MRNLTRLCNWGSSLLKQLLHSHSNTGSTNEAGVFVCQTSQQSSGNIIFVFLFADASNLYFTFKEISFAIFLSYASLRV